MGKIVEIDVLIVGAGPAGAAAAVFLGRYGIKVLMISRHHGTAETPRAHITNQRTMEALRDSGLEQECMQLASPGTHIEHTFWLRSMVGEELARTFSWGNDPRRSGEYAATSPCHMNDLPQTKLEPILVTEAARLGVQIRFGWELLSFTQDGEGVTAEVRDRLSDDQVIVRARYMIAADGARSRVAEQLRLPFVGKHGLGNVFNVLCDVDLSSHLEHRHGSLYSVIQPDSSYWAPVAVFRMVKAWSQWLVILIVPQAAGRPEPTRAEFEARIRESIGDDSLPLTILSTSMWTVNDVYAERYTEGRIFCMGDAVHRHPPNNGLGSNTCVQDAFNLAWKLAMVVNGKAGADLLASYDSERQPVGRQIVARANGSFVQNNVVWDLLGGGTKHVMGPEEHAAVFDTSEGRSRLRFEIDRMKYEFHAHGVEMERRYVSQAIIADGLPISEAAYDPELEYRPDTRPGSALPHVWLTHRLPGPRLSSLDVAGKGRFMLFTGPGGNAWRAAAHAFAEKAGVDVGVASIGPYCDYEDPYGWWAEYRGVGEDGAVLVRPDLIVAWRAPTLPNDPVMALDHAIRSILAL